jgi:hypothetical protein
MHVDLPPKPAIIRPAEPKLVQASVLPGWFPAGVAAARATLSFVDSVVSQDASSVTAPASVQAGDVLVLYDIAQGPLTVPPTTLPAGFTAISNIATGSGPGSLRSIISYKLANGAEANVSLSGLSGLFVDKVLVIMRRNPPASTLTVGGINAQATEADPSAQLVTASGAAPPLVVFGCSTGQSMNQRTMTPPQDGQVTVAATTWVAYKIFNSGPSDVSVDMGDEGVGNFLQSFYIQAG